MRIKTLFSWGAVLSVLLAGILATSGCEGPESRPGTEYLGRGELRIGVDTGNGLPKSLVSRVSGKERSWLSAPARLAVSSAVSGIQEDVTAARFNRDTNGISASADLAALGITLSHRLTIDGPKAVWEMKFTGEGKRTEHEVRIDLPVLFPEARIFTPSQYGVMEVSAYPSFEPVSYATYGWNDGQAYVLPLVCVMDPGSDSALTLALPADDNIPHLQVSWSEARLLSLRLGRRGMGGGRPTVLRLLAYVHPADYRSALKVYADDFPAYFQPLLPRGPYEGTFWYHHILDHPDFGEMARQHVRFIWTSFWFSHMGEFLPGTTEWYPYTYALEWKMREKMSDAKINAFIRDMHDHGIGVYAYFNVTEYGGTGGREGTTDEADRILDGQLGSALVRNAEGDTVPTWQGSKVMNPGRNTPLWPVLVEQARRHIERIPEFEGFMVDRLDWASGFDYSRDDGLSMDADRPMENLAVPVSEALIELCRQAHESGKRVFVNQFWRIELLRDSDGICHENDYLPALAYLTPFKPASAWHERRKYQGDLLPFEAQMKRRLHWALFPQLISHEFPVCQQEPNPRAADFMELFAPLFEPLLGKEQVLHPHCVEATGPNNANLFRNGKGFYVAPVTSRVRFLCHPPHVLEPSELVLRVPDADELEWAHIYSADTAPYRAPVKAEPGASLVRLEKHGTSSVAVVGKGPEPLLEDADAGRLAGIRESLFPQESRPPTAARPEIKDVTELKLQISCLPVGASYPIAVTEVMVDGRKVGEICDSQSWFEFSAPAEELPERPPVVGLNPGDEGTWLVPEKVDLIAQTRDGQTFRTASWETGDPCNAEGLQGIRLPLSWRAAVPVSPSSARFLGKDAATGGLWRKKAGDRAYWMSGTHEGETQAGYRMVVGSGRRFAWNYRVEDDPRVLQHTDSPQYRRRATCWFEPERVEVHLIPPDDSPYRLTAYFLDYDRVGRAEKILVSGGGEILDERLLSIQEIQDGVYLSWRVSGKIVLSVLKTAGANALLTGVFVDHK
jgi:hypothetical protein